jgi:hypothetical protein
MALSVDICFDVCICERTMSLYMQPLKPLTSVMTSFMKTMKQALLALLSAILCLTAVHSQVNLNEPNWEEMMRDPSISFYEIQAKFNGYWANRPIERGHGFKAFKRWEHFMTPRVTPVTGTWPEPDAVWQAMQESPQMFQQNQELPGSWTYIGNTSVPTGGGGAGRINSVRALPGSTTTWFACAPGGGLWKTTNSGTSWSVVGTDFLASIGCSDVAIDPSNTNVMYLATGDGDAGDTYALGILKTTDGGLTWNTTGLNWNVTQTRTTNRILIHPTNSQIVIAATSNGIWRTIDGGTNWTQEITGDFKDLIFKPSDPATVYACTDQFYVSTNTGDTFTNITTGLPTSANTQRMALAVSAANNAYVYILASGNDSGFLGVYRSINSGTSFTQMSSTPNLMGWSTDGSGTGGQGWYDLRIVADPANAEIVYTGGVNVYKSINGGTNWTLNGHWYGGGGAPYVHADIHALYFVPGSSPSRLLCGNDGGVFSTTNGGTAWSDLSSNLAIGQQYKLGLAALNSNLVLTGWQDNGTNLKNGAAHSRPLGGDGMECAIDPTNSNIMYGEIYYGSISKSTNGGASWSNIVASGGVNEDEDGAWVTPFVLGNTSGHIYVGKTRVYKSVDGGTTFTASGAFGSGNCNDLVIAPSNNNILFASKGSSLFKSIDNGATFTAVSGLPSHYITDIAIHKTDANKVWVTFSNYTAGQKVYYSSNGGTSWTNISGSLPNLPANAVVFQPLSNNGIYVGMDAGIYFRDDALGAWVPYITDLPNVEIYELEIHEATNTITAATYGRGLWRAPVYALPNLDAVLLTVNAPTGSSCNLNVTPSIDILNSGTTTITSMTIQYQVTGQALQTYSWTGSLASTATATITLPVLNYGAGSFTINFTITAVNGGVDDAITNNTGTSNYVTINGTNQANLILTTDCYPGETSWEVTNSSNQVLFTGSGYANNSVNNIPLCLPTECFTFRIFDSYGDGLFGGGNCSDGDYQIVDNLTSTVLVDNLFANGNFGFDETHSFCYPLSAVPGCTDIAACNYNASATNDDGTCAYAPVNDLCAGAIQITTFGTPISVSNITTCSDVVNPTCGGTQIKDVWYKFTYTGGTVSIATSGGTLTDTRLAVYSSCGGPLIACDDDDNTGNYSLINFGCTAGTGASGANEATLLVIGQTYYIQVGGFNALTGTFNLTVTITNVSGCTNPAACNYNPCANVNSGCVLPVTYYQDADGDTYGNTAVTLTQCNVPAGYVTVSGDCNDTNNAINPGATESHCNGVDDNCNTTIDEGRINGCTNPLSCNYNVAATCDNGTCTSAVTWYLNGDGDNYYAGTQVACTSPGAGWTTTMPSGGAGDCNDSNSAIYPGAIESLCNGVDDNCNTTIDEGRVNGCTNSSACNYNSAATCDNGSCILPSTWYLNSDGDNYHAGTQVACASPGAGWTLIAPFGGGDCADNNAAVNPSATEICGNLTDDDCDGLIDETCVGSAVPNDNFLAASNVTTSVTHFPNCTMLSGDCSLAANSSESSNFTGNDVWYQFVALSQGMRITLTSAGMDGALQLLTDDQVTMVNGSENVVSTGQQEIMNVNGLTIGDVYYLSVGSASSSGAPFTLCLQYLAPSRCNTNTSLPLDLCAAFKAKSVGANSYTYTFTPLVAGTGGGSITIPGSIQLSNTALNLLPGASYTVTITANFTSLVNGAGALEPQSITTNLPCVVTINSGPSMAVRSTQWCSAPATLLRSSYLRADPFSCGATSYTFRFTPAQNCTGTAAGASFEMTSINRVLQLNFNGSSTVPSGMTISNQTYYNVEVRANHGPGGSVPGTYGPIRTIFVGGTNSTESIAAEEPVITSLALSTLEIYPNPSFDQSIVLQADHFQEELVEITVFDQTGRLVQKDQILVEQGLYYDFNTDHAMSAGIYIVELKSPSTLMRGQFIIQK